jgi:topoisomerase-4 subunit A
MVSGAKVLKQIADQIQSKNLQLITDLRDESDHENPTRLVLVPKSNRVDADEVMLHLFATTDLEKSYRVNFNMIGIDGRPQVKNLLKIITEWLEFRLGVVRARLEHRLAKIIDRLHILEGLLIAYLNLDQVIKIIRTADNPKEKLIKKFKLTEVQASAILDLKLRHLAKLEEIKIKEEAAKLTTEQEQITAILNSKAKLKSLVKKEIQETSKKLADLRCSEIATRPAAKLLAPSSSSKGADSEVTVVLSDKGWVRCGKGHEIDPLAINYKSGEHYKSHARGLSSQSAVFLDSVGKSYSLSTTSLPSMRGYGEPLTSKLSQEDQAVFEFVIMGNVQQKILLLQAQGYGFITDINNLTARTKTGKNIINLSSKLLPPLQLTANSKYLVLLASDLKLLVLDISIIPELNKGRGRKLINMSKKHGLLSAVIIEENKDLLIQQGKKQHNISYKKLTNFVGDLGESGKKLDQYIKLTKGASAKNVVLSI